MKYLVALKILLSIIFFVGCACPQPLLKPEKEELTGQAPTEFRVEVETTKGNILIEIEREYSPLAVDRFYYLVNNNYYDQNRFFRVLPKFVVQWGMKGVPEIDEIWENLGIIDEPVKLSNAKGTICFARGGVNSRSNQMFINLENNARLDNSDFNGVKGFPAFGKVIEGMDIVESLYSGYLQTPNQDSIKVLGNEYLNKNFPKLDYIISTKIVLEK